MRHIVRLPTALAVLLAFALFDPSGAAAPAAPPPSLAGVWEFDGSLVDASGRGNTAFTPAPAYVAGRAGQALACDNGGAVVPDAAELRPAPGLTIDCWVRFDALVADFRPLLLKQNEYQLRLDPASEGSHVSFFLYAHGWEPRVRSRAPAVTGRWLHVRAGWDGQTLWLEMDGQRSSVARPAAAAPSHAPLEIGPFPGAIDRLRIDNPAAKPTAVARWTFDGDLKDASGNRHDWTGKAGFAPSDRGQALRAASSVRIADDVQLRLAPGLCLDCSIYVARLPDQYRTILVKNNEYQLRLNAANEGGGLAFFVYLDGWEPRVASAGTLEPGKWHRVIARWDGSTIELEVDGQRTRAHRSGIARPASHPLVLGSFDGLIDELAIENPRLPALIVADARQRQAILVAGRDEAFVTAVRNLGAPAPRASVELRVPRGVRLLQASPRELGPIGTGEEKSFQWTVRADAPPLGKAEIVIDLDGDAGKTIASHPLVFFAAEDGRPVTELPRSEAAAVPAAAGATTWYIDGIAGNNAAAGTSPERAWKDFTPIGGKTLGPGERLLLRRGSVFRQELQLSARGARDRWAEIAAYGEGPRPIIRRNWDIDDRCVLVSNPDYLRIRGLVVAHAGKGLIVNYSRSGHRGLLVEDCIAHHIEGLYRFNSHGIPPWLGRRGATGDRIRTSAGIAIAGPVREAVLRDCEMFQCSAGFVVEGEDVLVDRVHCHDNFAHNTSPHPFLVNVRRAVLQNSLFDAAGWHASAGTMGIMLGDPQGLIIRNCHFRNQPDSGSHDEGGIDFENRGNGCLIDRCTFENNAGAAIEILGLKTPQTTNVEIRRSRFIRNNHAKKLGPAEIFIWGKVRDPSVCRSTGWVRDNGYLLAPGVGFWVNEAPLDTHWTLENNVEYAGVDALKRALPWGRPPLVDAGADLATAEQTAALRGAASNPGRSDRKPALCWQLLEGPGRVDFADPSAAATTAHFQRAGDYTLRLTARTRDFQTSDYVVAHVLAGEQAVRTWDFNRNLDKEGWTEADLGTRVQHWPDDLWPTVAHPVHIAAGGFYIVALQESREARLLSPPGLDIELSGDETLVVRMQNGTPARQMRLHWLFDRAADGGAASRRFDVVPNDSDVRSYRIALPPGTKAGTRLRQLRLDLADGAANTGVCRVDYVMLARPIPR